MCATVDDESGVTVGRVDWFHAKMGLVGVTVRCKRVVSKWEDVRRSSVWLHVSWVGLDLFGVEDAVREDRFSAGKRLTEMGMTGGMVTGDALAIGRYLATSVRISCDEDTEGGFLEYKARTAEHALSCDTHG